MAPTTTEGITYYYKAEVNVAGVPREVREYLLKVILLLLLYLGHS
jgi:hypothetical protein